jgi:uncharacterized membrane protein
VTLVFQLKIGVYMKTLFVIFVHDGLKKPLFSAVMTIYIVFIALHELIVLAVCVTSPLLVKPRK